MNIKTKLTLGVGLLFILIVLLCLVGASKINALKNDTKNILVANYNSLEYCRNMISSLEDLSDKALHNFERNLQLQEANLTEPGEYDATFQVRKNINKLKQDSLNHQLLGEIRKSISTIMDLNMQAIQRKSEVAAVTADKAVLWIALTGTLCFLIAFILLVNLPAAVANPIKELTKSIQQIAAKNYSERVHFEGHSEFGQLAMSFNTMAKKLEEYNNSNLAKLMMEKKRIETLINNMHDPVIGLDENLVILFANEAATKVTGLMPEELPGKSARELASKNDLIRILIKELEGNPAVVEPKKTPMKIFAENRESYFEKETFHISIIPTGEKDPRLIGHVIFLRNITSHKELDFAKTNFIATVSHEIKTPITSIKMSLQLLENKQIGSLNEEQLHLIESIQEDTHRLLRITGELLNMTQVESGNIQLSIIPSNPKEILTYALQAMKTQAEKKDIQFEVQCPENTSQVLADKDKTAWVLTNLISNAIRYSYEHSTIYIRLLESPTNVTISVKDTGQGIAPQYKDKIFERYFRVPGTQKEGTGLGLAISKEFMEAQGGQIFVESEYGAGSTFTLMLHKAG